MFIQNPLPFVENYVDTLNKELTEYSPGQSLSRSQQRWLGFCLMGILLTNSINWHGFSRIGLGQYKVSALSWMFRHSKIAWEHLFHISLRIVLRQYEITEGVLAIDDSEKKRSKTTKAIYGTHKMKDKSTGGYFMGQSLVFLVLVTPYISIPAGFAFYRPDPILSKWYRNNKKLKKKGVVPKKRPKKPERSSKYPTISTITNNLIDEFTTHHPGIHIRAVVADALYGTSEFMDMASTLIGGAQVVSQLRSNQNIKFKNKMLPVKEYFNRYPPVAHKIRIRGGDEVTVYISSARLYVNAHQKKRFIIALKYEGETESRYLVATDLTWRTIDIVQVYTLRWLIEVFFEDHKAHEGWGRLTKQPGEDGSYRSLTLSLLVDHCLFFHPQQMALKKNNLPAKTVGTLCESIKIDCILNIIKEIVTKHDPQAEFQQLSNFLKEQFGILRDSKKHMSAREWGNYNPSPLLKYKAAE